jgi:hypothetical protein
MRLGSIIGGRGKTIIAPQSDSLTGSLKIKLATETFSPLECE